MPEGGKLSVHLPNIVAAQPSDQVSASSSRDKGSRDGYVVETPSVVFEPPRRRHRRHSAVSGPASC